MTLYSIGKADCSDAWRQARLLAGVLLMGGAALLHILRATLFALLHIFQPFVSFALSAIAVLGLLTAITMEASATAETFPFWRMMAFSLASAMLLALYDTLLRFLSQ